MNEHIQLGVEQIVNFSDYFIILFVLTLLSPYQLRDFKTIFILLSSITFGTLMYLLFPSIIIFIENFFLNINSQIFKTTPAILVLTTALYTVFIPKKKKKLWIYLLFATLSGLLFFLGKFEPVSNLTIIHKLHIGMGIEMGLIIICCALLLFNYLLKKIPGITQRYWTYYLNYLGIIWSGFYIWNLLF